MKGSIVKSVMLLLTVINIQGIVEYSENKEFIHFIEEVEEKESFYESGLMYQYNSTLEISDEINRVFDSLLKEEIYDIEKQRDEVSAKIIDGDINIHMYKDGLYTKVEVRITNYNKEKSLSKLRNELNKFNWNKVNNQEVHIYQKFKIENEQEFHTYLDENVKDIKETEYNNGCFGTGHLNDNKRISFVFSKYDTGYFFIVGTPRIYISY